MNSNKVFEIFSDILGVIFIVLLIICFIVYIKVQFNKLSDYTVLTDNNYCIEQINDKTYKLYQCDYMLEQIEIDNQIINFKKISNN